MRRSSRWLALVPAVAVLVGAALLSAATDTEKTRPEPVAGGIGSGFQTLFGDGPAPTRVGVTDDDGIRPRRRHVELVALPEPVDLGGDHDEHAHFDATAGIAIEVPERPEMVIIDDVDAGSQLAVRSRNDGVWSAWVDIEASEDEAPDGAPGGEGEPPDGVTAVGPIWLGRGADLLEIAGLSGDTDITIETLEVIDVSGTQQPRGIRSNAAAVNDFIRPRTDWATTDMRWASENEDCGSAPKMGGVTGMIVHHTAGANGYANADVPAIMRGIWYFHVQNRGWCDVAYNFFVDRFGQIWEGRQGGIERPVIGGHTFGFNTYTSAIAQLGNYETAGAPSAMTTATAQLVGWKLSLHGVDPTGHTTYVNSASVPAKDGTPPGGTKRLPSIVGHRDLGSTSCPGRHTYARLNTIRDLARVGAHTRALFEAFIGRSPGTGEYGNWSSISYAIGLGGAADRLAHSDTYAGVVVDELYRIVLGRDPDTGGRNYWLQQLRNGLTVADMSVYFYGGEEYYTRTGGRGGYVDALYRALLHRKADDSGRRYWIDVIDRGASPTVVAASFIDSIESRRDRVARLYRRFLGRNPDAGGHAYWADVLQGTGDLELATFLALSEEFYNRRY